MIYDVFIVAATFNRTEVVRDRYLGFVCPRKDSPYYYYYYYRT